MHVARVELENIKCYEHADYRFERGTTAITGENGAGKTTILEAIAWALFDTLEYSKDDFLKRGAKRGSVRVTFESDLDERQYTVYRDTAQGYYIYDNSLGIRIAEKKIDVSATLRKFLGIEIGTDLKALFSSAIGVPQGTFTADFLRPTNQRKASFDRLLKVEEYRDGADRLLGTVHLIREKMAEARGRITVAEAQLVGFDELVEEQRLSAKSLASLESEVCKLKQEIEDRTKAVSRMDEIETQVKEARSHLERLQITMDEALRRVAYLRTQRDTSAAAVSRLQEARPEHLLHLSTLETLHALERDRKQRDLLKSQAEESSGQLLSSQIELRHLNEALERAILAKATIVKLQPEIIRQEQFEHERERLRDLRAQAVSARERLAQIELEVRSLHTQHSQMQKRLKEASAGEGAQTLISQMEGERAEVQTILNEAEMAVTSHKHLENQRKQAALDAERLRGVVKGLEREIAELGKHSTMAARVGSLEANEKDLTERLANLKAEMHRDDQFHREVKDGLCPILSQRCLNIEEGQTLEHYFINAFATNSAHMRRLESERNKVSTAVVKARNAEKLFSRLDLTRARLADERRLLIEREAMLKDFEVKLSALPTFGLKDRRDLNERLSTLEKTLKQLHDKALRYAHLQTLQERISEIIEEGKSKRKEQASATATAGNLPAIEKEIAQAEANLSKLKDPRGRSISLHEDAARESELRSSIAVTSASERELVSRQNALAVKLERFAALDQQWERACQIRENTVGAHRDYLANERLAAALPHTQEELVKAEAEAGQKRCEADSAKQKLDIITDSYQAEHHTNERAALVTARERAAAEGAQMEAARIRKASIDAEVRRLTSVRDSLREEFKARERLEELSDATEFIRDTLKQAGPLVTESYLYNISVEANQLFREITGESGRSLRWSRDYEIILEEEGYERAFPNLSGGEQMAAALAVRLAILKQLSDIRIAFFDEPTINMDSERRERLAEQLGKVEDFDQLFVISHDDTFEEAVDHVLHIAPRAGDAVGVAG